MLVCIAKLDQEALVGHLARCSFKRDAVQNASQGFLFIHSAVKSNGTQAGAELGK